MTFAGISVKANGDKITYSFFNDIRTAGIALEAALGSAGFIGETQMTIANNQTSAANITGLVFGSTIRAAIVEYFIRRSDSDNEYMENGKLLMQRKSTGCLLTKGESLGDADVEVTITTDGQCQYTSGNMTGSGYAGKMKFTARVLGLET